MPLLPYSVFGRCRILSSSANVLVSVLTMPSLWDRFSSSSSSSPSSLSRTPTPDQPPRSAWGSAAREEGLGRCASLESSDCESLDSSNSGFGPEDGKPRAEAEAGAAATRGPGRRAERRAGRSQTHLGFLSHQNPDCGGMEEWGRGVGV